MIKGESKYTGAMPAYQVIAKSESKDALPDFYYIDPETGEQHLAVKKGNSLFTAEGHHLCDVHFTGPTPNRNLIQAGVDAAIGRPKAKPNRKQRRSKK